MTAPKRLCWTCSARIVPCGCHGHGGPMWKHQATGHHRCGPTGTDLSFASDAPPKCDCGDIPIRDEPGTGHQQWCEMYGRAVTP